jgi:hypothetical protein
MAYSTNPDGDCYCHLWDKDPEHFREMGVPEGYCGLCSAEVGGKRCNRPGHVRSGPGPYTFCHCEEHEGGKPIHCGCVALAALLVLLLVAAAVAAWFWFF